MDLNPLEKKSYPSILLINFHSSQNAGDAALLETSIYQLKETFNNPNFTVSANYPDEIFLTTLDVEVVPSPASIIYSHKRILMQLFSFSFGLLLIWFFKIVSPKIKGDRLTGRWFDLAAAYQNASLILSLPGNQFLSMGLIGWPIVVSAMSVYLAHLFQKPFYVLPQSIGPFHRWWEKKLMKWLYGRARLVFFREDISIQLASDLGIPKFKMNLGIDPAFTLPSIDQQETNHYLKRYNIPSDNGTIGVTVINRMVKTLDREKIEIYYSALANTLDYMIRKYGVKIIFFPQVIGPTKNEDDRIAAQIVASQMNSVEDNIILIKDPLFPKVLKGLYKCMDAFIASRLHSGIFAISSGTPVMFIGYFTKTKGILESIGYQNWHIDLEDLDENQMLIMIERLWLSRKEVRSQLDQLMPQIIQESIRVDRLIADNYLNEQ
jgi:colanic acid/amylovoran biosynthesis protein